MSQIKFIKRPSEIKDNLLWDLLSRLLEFDQNKRITAAEALQHPYFTSPEELSDISKEQKDLASLAAVAELEGDSSITEFDKDPTFIVSECIIKQFILNYIHRNQPKYKNKTQLIKQQISQIEEIQTIYEVDEQDNEYEMMKFAIQISLQNDDNNEQSQQQTSQSKFDQYIKQNLEFESPFEQKSLQLSSLNSSYSNSQNTIIEQSQSQSKSLNFQVQNEQQIYSFHAHSIPKINSKSASLQYIATEEQLQAERDLLELNMNLIEMKEKFEIFSNLQFLERDVVCVNLCKLHKGNKKNCIKAQQLGILTLSCTS